MNTRKIDLILENIRDQYSLEILEESEVFTESEILKGKILINESTMMIRKMLVDDGILESTRNYMGQLFTEALMQEDGAMPEAMSKGDMDYYKDSKFKKKTPDQTTVRKTQIPTDKNITTNKVVIPKRK